MTKQVEEVVEQVDEPESFEAAFDEIAAAKDDGFDAAQEKPVEEPTNKPQEAAEDAASEVVEVSDPLAKLNDDQLRHRLKSDGGRISAMQRKISDLESQVQAQQVRQKPAQPQQAPSQWDEVQQDYPEIADGVKALVEQKLAALDGVSSRVEQFERRDAQQQRDREIEALTERHPDWQEVSRSQEFGDWVQQQPAQVQSLRSSQKAADAAWMLDLYVKTKPQAESQSQAQQLTTKRNRALAAAQETPTHRRTPTAADESDFESAFEHYARLKER